jgi:hypothetical protein
MGPLVKTHSRGIVAVFECSLAGVLSTGQAWEIIPRIVQSNGAKARSAH